MFDKKTYLKYLKQQGLPVMLFTGLVTKAIKIYLHGAAAELRPKVILLDILAWTLAAFAYAYCLYYWYYIRPSKLK